MAIAAFTKAGEDFNMQARQVQKMQEMERAKMAQDDLVSVENSGAAQDSAKGSGAAHDSAATHTSRGSGAAHDSAATHTVKVSGAAHDSAATHTLKVGGAAHESAAARR